MFIELVLAAVPDDWYLKNWVIFTALTNPWLGDNRSDRHKTFLILCNVGGYLITYEYQLYRVTPLKTLFRLLIRFIYNFTSRNYNHL
jgi:hypothetical protein